MNFVRIYLLTLATVLATPESVAQLIRCGAGYSAIAHRDKLVQLAANPRRPQLGNRVNPSGLQQWVEAHRVFGKDYLHLWRIPVAEDFNRVCS